MERKLILNVVLVVFLFDLGKNEWVLDNWDPFLRYNYTSHLDDPCWLFLSLQTPSINPSLLNFLIHLRVSEFVCILHHAWN